VVVRVRWATEVGLLAESSREGLLHSLLMVGLKALRAG